MKFSGAVLISVIIAILCGAFPAFAQGSIGVQVHSFEAIPFNDKVGYTVDLFLSVIDANNTPIGDLKPANFKLLEDSKPVEILTAEPVENEAISIVLLMDNSGSMSGALNDARNAAAAFLEKLGRNDKSAVLSFNDELLARQAFTSDHHASSEAVRQITVTTSKGTCLYDSIYKGIEMALTAEPGRRAVVVFTDGKDELLNGSACSVKILQDVLDISKKNNVPIYPIGMGNKIDERELKRIADSSGGAYYKAENSSKIDEAFTRLFEQMSNEYKISYISVGSPGSHSMAVEVEYHGAKDQASYGLTLPTMPTIIKFQSPKENAALSGKVLLAAIFLAQSAEISAVRFYYNGQFVGESVSLPFSYTWDVSQIPPDSKAELEAVAFGKDGAELSRTKLNAAIVETVPEFVPEIEFSSPQKGSEHMGSVTLRSNVSSNNIPVGSVEYYGNSKYLGKVVTPPFEYEWDVSAMPSGNVNLDSVAYSKDGKELARANLMFYVRAIPPTETPMPTKGAAPEEEVQIQFDSLEKGSEHMGNVELRINVQSGSSSLSGADNAGGIASVEFYGNKKYLGKVVSAPFAYDWNISGLPSGNMDIEAVAYSRDGKQLARANTMIYVKEVPPTEQASAADNIKIQFDSIENGSEHMGNVMLRINIQSASSDSYGADISDIVGNVEYYGNKKFLGKVVTSPFEYDWDISRLPSGKMDVEAVAISKEGKQLAQTALIIYVKAIPPTETPAPTLIAGFIREDQLPMYIGIGVATLIGIIIIILLARKKKEPERESEPFSLRRGDDGDSPTFDGVMPGIVGKGNLADSMATLEVIASDDVALLGNVYNITSLPISIGRSVENEVIFSKKDQAISRRHAILEEGEDGIIIRDSGSKYGTFVNEEAIGSDIFLLKSGDEIKLGTRTKLKFTKLLKPADGGSEEVTMDDIGVIDNPDDSTVSSF